MTSNTYLTQNQALHIYQTHSQTWYKISGGNARAAQRGSHHASSRSEKRIGEQGELLCLRSRAYGLLVCKLTARSDAPLSIGLTSYQPSAARRRQLEAGVDGKFGRLSRSDRHETRCVYSRQVYKHGTEENGAKFSISFRAGSSAA